MKIQKILIFTFLICSISCKNENEINVNDNHKYVKLLWKNKQFDWIPTTLVNKDKFLYFGNLDREFYCVNLQNSKVNLKFKTDYNPFFKSLIFDKNIVLTEYSSDLNCFDSIGKLKWKLNGEINLKKDLSENGEFIYGSVKGNGFSKLNKMNGEVIWFLPKDSNITETNKPVFFQNIIYLGLEEHNVKLLAINNGNGKIVWENKYENFANLSQVNTKKGLLVCLDKDFEKGKILMLNYQSGKEYWTQSLNCDTYYEPCVIQNNIILSTYNNKVISLNIENGKTNWKLNLKKDQVESRIVNYKENLYFGTMNRNLYSINNKTGKINFIQPFNYGISTPIVENDRIYFPTGGSEIWILK